MRRWLAILIFAPALWSADLLHSGEILPDLAGETLSGKPIALPSALAGAPTVVVFSFSKAGGKDSQHWTEKLQKDFSSPQGPRSFTAIFLESVPSLFRGMALAGIKSGVPAAMHERTLVSYKNEAEWKARLAAKNTSRSYVVLVDEKGLVRWMGLTGFSEAEYARLKTALADVKIAGASNARD